MGCLFAIFAGAFPRIGMIIYWIARPEKIDKVFSSAAWPVLGIIFVPLTTLVYSVLWTAGVGVTGWKWFWVGLAFLFDVGHWAAGAGQRNRVTRGQRV
jgi:hypothetical protein